MRRSILVLALLLALSGATRRACAADDATIAIATIEHRRADPAGLDPFLAPSASSALRARAIRALGRLGARPGVEVRLLDLIRRGGPDLALVLEAAGQVGGEALTAAVVGVMGSTPPPPPEVRRAGYEALGRLPGPEGLALLRRGLAEEGTAERDAAALALGRLGAEAALEELLARGEGAPESAACWFGVWRCAGGRRKAATTPTTPWAGEPALAARVAAVAATTRDLDARLFAHRALHALAPKALDGVSAAPTRPAWLVRLLDAPLDADPQLAADLAFRLGAANAGEAVETALAAGLAHASALVRETCVEALGAQGTAGAGARLALAAAQETDGRVREAMAVAAARCGHEILSSALLARPDRPGTTADRERTEAAALLASKGPQARARLEALSARAGLSDAARIVLFEGLVERIGEARKAAAKAPTEAPAFEAVPIDPADWLDAPDPRLRAATLALLAATQGLGALETLAVAYDRATREARMADVRQVVLESLKEALERDGLPPARNSPAPSGPRERLLALVGRALLDEAAAVRAAARALATLLPEWSQAAIATDPRPNDWRGLPRPAGEVLGQTFPGTGPWLDEAEVLRLAERIAQTRAQVVFETEAGRFVVALDVDAAPVHAAALVLHAARGGYDDTPWHRVVPAFVVQGGDPRGDGSGDAGYALPDEVTTTPFRRGVLGMPKSTKDTGGCQVFLMHRWAPHLDGNYTAYGHVLEGVEVLDALRVGDRIRSARVAIP